MRSQGRHIAMGSGKQAKQLTVEFPGGMVHITCGLHDVHGHAVTNVSVSADGDRYAGNPEWWAVNGEPDEKGIGTRIIQCDKNFALYGPNVEQEANKTRV